MRWKVTTVSWSYLEELRYNSNGLESLFEYERGKCTGILNGIDSRCMGSATDKFIEKNYDAEECRRREAKIKKRSVERFSLRSSKTIDCIYRKIGW